MTKQLLKTITKFAHWNVEYAINYIKIYRDGDIFRLCATDGVYLVDMVVDALIEDENCGERPLYIRQNDLLKALKETKGKDFRFLIGKDKVSLIGDRIVGHYERERDIRPIETKLDVDFPEINGHLETTLCGKKKDFPVIFTVYGEGFFNALKAIKPKVDDAPALGFFFNWEETERVLVSFDLAKPGDLFTLYGEANCSIEDNHYEKVFGKRKEFFFAVDICRLKTIMELLEITEQSPFGDTISFAPINDTGKFKEIDGTVYYEGVFRVGIGDHFDGGKVRILLMPLSVLPWSGQWFDDKDSRVTIFKKLLSL